MLGVNVNLSGDIVVCWVKYVLVDFYVWFSVMVCCYCYVIYNYCLCLVVLSYGVMYFYQLFDVECMQCVVQCLLGENDFILFCVVQCQLCILWCNVMYINVICYGVYVVVDIKVNVFVYYMVRNIVGSLMEVGVGNQLESWMVELLVVKDRMFVVVMVKVEGLYLVLVDYLVYYDLLVLLMGLLFLVD